jgi:hypothetical protein
VSDVLEVMTYHLLTTADGGKMGKTAAGAVWLDANRLSPYDYYQYWINCDDRDVEKLLKIFTFLPLDEIKRLAALEGAERKPNASWPTKPLPSPTAAEFAPPRKQPMPLLSGSDPTPCRLPS